MLGALLGGAGALANLAGGLFGGDDEYQSMPTQQSGFAALPPQLQSAYLNTYLPEALRQYNEGYTPPPMGRAGNSFWDSKGLQELQKYSDRLAAQKAVGAQNAQPQAPTQGFGGFGNMNPIQQNIASQMVDSLYRNNKSALGGGPFDQNIFRGMFGLGGNNPFPNAPAGFPAAAPIGGMPNAAPAGGGMGAAGATGAAGGASGLYNGTMGVRPLASVEPLNDIQKNAILSAAGAQGSNVNDYLNPYAAQGLSQLSGLAANPEVGPYGLLGGKNMQANVPDYLIPDHVLRGQISQYMNPYTDQVINRTLDRMKEQVAGGRNSILGDAASLGSLGAFGSSALGTRLSNLENEALNRTQDFMAQQNQANYSQALGNALNQYNLGANQFGTDVDRAMQMHYGDIGMRNNYLQNLLNGGNQSYETASNLGNTAFGQRRQTLQDMISAGNRLQQQHQNELNAANPHIQQTLPSVRLSQLGANLGMFPQNSAQAFNYNQKPNMFNKIGGFATGLGGLFDSFGGM